MYAYESTDLELRATDARKTSARVTVEWTVAIAGKDAGVVSGSTSARGVRDGAAELVGLIELERGALAKRERAALRRWFGQLMARANAETIAEAVHRQRVAGPAKPNGRTMLATVVGEAPKIEGLTFLEDDGKIWSEVHARPVDRRDFAHAVSPELVAHVEKASDYPTDCVGARYAHLAARGGRRHWPR